MPKPLLPSGSFVDENGTGSRLFSSDVHCGKNHATECELPHATRLTNVSKPITEHGFLLTVVVPVPC